MLFDMGFPDFAWSPCKISSINDTEKRRPKHANPELEITLNSFFSIKKFFQHDMTILTIFYAACSYPCSS